MRDAEDAVRDAMLNGTPGQRKALLKELVVEVRVESRDSMIPTFRLPAISVRVTKSMVGRGFRNANPRILVEGRPISLKRWLARREMVLAADRRRKDFRTFEEVEIG